MLLSAGVAFAAWACSEASFRPTVSLASLPRKFRELSTQGSPGRARMHVGIVTYALKCIIFPAFAPNALVIWEFE
jgi:hypothetical protein